MGGCFEGLGTEPPTAEGQWGSGGEAPSRRKLGVWGQSPQPPEARGSGALQNFAFFCKNNLILGAILIKKIMLLKRGLEIGNANMIKLVA